MPFTHDEWCAQHALIDAVHAIPVGCRTRFSYETTSDNKVCFENATLVSHTKFGGILRIERRGCRRIPFPSRSAKYRSLGITELHAPENEPAMSMKKTIPHLVAKFSRQLSMEDGDAHRPQRPRTKPRDHAPERSIARCARAPASVEKKQGTTAERLPPKGTSIFSRDGLLFATINGRNLASDAKLHRLVSFCVAHGIAICLVQETKRPCDEEIDLGGWHYVGSACSLHEAGIGVLVHPKLSSRLKAFRTILPGRLQELRFDTFILMNVYQYTQDKRQDREMLWTKLEEALPRDALPTVIAGDFNCDPRRKNPQDIELAEFALLAGCKLKEHKKATFPRSRSQLDHLMVTARYASSLGRTRIFDPGIDSDHLMVVTRVKIRLARGKPKVKLPDPDETDFDLLGYSSEARLRYHHAFQKAAAEHPPDSFTKLATLINEVGASTLPTKTKAPAMQTRWTKHEQTLNEIRACMDEQIKTNSSKYEELLSHNPWVAWKHARVSVDRAPRRMGATLGTEEFTNHFQSLLNPTPPAAAEDARLDAELKEVLLSLKKPNAHFKRGAFLATELSQAVLSMANHKATGPSQTPIEPLRCASVQEALLPLINAMLRDGKIDDTLLESFVVPLFKKGCIEQTSNYRGIFLLEQVLKVVNRMILARLQVGFGDTLSPLQNAYRRHRGCQQHILAAAQLRAIACAHRTPLAFLFVDFTKAFDSLRRRALKQILDWWGVPSELQLLIFDMMDRQRVRVRLSKRGDPGEVFGVAEGVLQGDTLAPTLFLLGIDIILKRLSLPDFNRHGVEYDDPVLARTTRSRTVRAADESRFPGLAYADDILLASNSTSGAQILLHELQRVGSLLGLQINIYKDEKTALMTWNTTGTVHALDGTVVPPCTKYKYLGWVCTKVGSAEADWRRRRQLAFAIHHKYRNVWKHGSDRVKHHMLWSIVLPTLTYGLSTYSWTEKWRHTITQTFHRLVRSTFGIRVDWTKFTHKRVESIIHNRHLFVTSAFALSRLTEVGTWIRDHYNDVTTHPVISILEWDKGGPNSPRAALLQMAQVDDWDTLCKLADSPKRWAKHCEKCALAEERAIAQYIGRRRENEDRRWNATDTRTLLEKRAQAATEWLARRKSN
jgi:hypothetical protein